MLDSNDKGAIVEHKPSLWPQLPAGVSVLRPLAEHGRCDLAFDAGGRSWRVQCKWGRLVPRRRCCDRSPGDLRRTSDGFLKRTYAVDEVDLFAIYCGDLDRAYLLPAADMADRREVRLRLTPARNRQSDVLTWLLTLSSPGL